MNVDMFLFLTLAIVAVISAVSMIVSRNAIYSALFLVLNFLTVAALYLLLNAAFIAMVQITVYAGAIMVLFLFVIMLLGAEHVEDDRGLPWQKPVSLILGAVVLAEMAYILFFRAGQLLPVMQDVDAGFGSPRSIGLVLFDSYTLPFEITSILLLAAMVGSILLVRDDRKEEK
ncbi:MAG: NADH-quinone oxidoreductase subunit J [Anaerolineales bacterium]|nr:NADH-quinone oxidoreductase subunit J [Anaerolineales bacterium]